MRKFLLIVLPFILAVIVFSLIIFFLAGNREKGALQVTSNPLSKVYLDNKLIGQTPLCKCELKDMISQGNHSLKLVPIKGNFEPFEQNITISSKVLTVVDRNFAETGLANASIISLTPIDNKKDAQISAVTFPDSVEVFLDNNLVGQTPILLKNITDSDHELKFTKEGYKDKIVNIKTVLGYKLEALIFLGLNPQVATSSATLISTPSSSLSATKVIISQTPTGYLRVRKDASLGSLEIARVKPGEVYNLVGEKTGWFEIKLNDGKVGWISSQYAKKQI